MRKIIVAAGLVAGGLAAGTVDAADIKDCTVHSVEVELLAEPVSPFMPPVPLDEPKITVIQECAVLERVPTIEGGTTTIRSDMLIETVIQGEHLDGIVEVVADLLAVGDELEVG